jgi:hypothetical protein
MRACQSLFRGRTGEIEDGDGGYHKIILALRAVKI